MNPIWSLDFWRERERGQGSDVFFYISIQDTFDIRVGIASFKDYMYWRHV